MRRRKYIRFDSTQALHTRVTSAERRDYRIIARARASDLSLTRALASMRWTASQCRARSRADACCVAADMQASREFPLCPYILGVSEDSAYGSRRNSSRRRNWSQARKTAREARSWPRRTYQIETTRMLIAIEFFLVVVITFLSSRRCKRRPPRSKRAANQADSRVRFDSRQTPSRLFSASLTACGLALPPVDFMT